MGQVVSGNNLVVKFGEEGSEVIVACSTSCTLTINQATVAASCKDGDGWAANIPGEKSWEVTVDALYKDDDASGTGGFVDLSALIIGADANNANLVFEEINNPVNIANGNQWAGAVVMTSCTLNGPANDNSTFSATFSGNGPLSFTPGSPTV